jgi:eukaryotic-like serine/threonine-protein kinase
MRVLDTISRGGFGRVERVESLDGTILARKVFDPSHLMGDLTPDHREKLLKRFAREVKIQTQLSKNGGVIPVLASSLDVDPPWFTMPLAPKTLRQQIAEDRAAKRVTPEPLADVLNALEQIHRLGYVHRDLKPENVLLDGGTWKLADFGLAVHVKSDTTTRLTSTGLHWGTESYCAPEQRVEFKRVGPEADIYAFGCILHDLVEGKPRLPYQQQNGPPPYGSIIRKCTALDPKKRFPSIAPLRALLLTAVRTAPAIEATDRTKEWTQALNDIAGWSSEKMEEFAAFVREEKMEGPLAHEWLIFSELTEERLRALHDKDADVWSQIAIAYCDWAGARNAFTFAYCDVVVDRLGAIYTLGTLEEQAAAATAAAILGASHHRYFVMDRVLAMGGPGVVPVLAERIALEVSANALEEEFRNCAEVRNRTIDEYHPLIAQAIRSGPPKTVRDL